MRWEMCRLCRPEGRLNDARHVRWSGLAGSCRFASGGRWTHRPHPSRMRSGRTTARDASMVSEVPGGVPATFTELDELLLDVTAPACYGKSTSTSRPEAMTASTSSADPARWQRCHPPTHLRGGAGVPAPPSTSRTVLTVHSEPRYRWALRRSHVVCVMRPCAARPYGLVTTGAGGDHDDRY